MRFKPLILLLVVFFLLAAGCSNHVKIKGKVTFDDGSPLGKGTVCFDSGNYVATGILSSDGSYVLGSVKQNDGIPRGTYKVYITGAIQYGDTKTNRVPQRMSDGSVTVQNQTYPSMHPMIDSKFTSSTTTDITCEVTKSMVYDIKVKPPLN